MDENEISQNPINIGDGFTDRDFDNLPEKEKKKVAKNDEDLRVKGTAVDNKAAAEIPEAKLQLDNLDRLFKEKESKENLQEIQKSTAIYDKIVTEQGSPDLKKQLEEVKALAAESNEILKNGKSP